MNTEPEVRIASPLPVIFSGLVNGGLFCLVWYLAFTKGAEPSRGQLALLNVGFLLSTVVVAQIFFRRSIGTKVTYIKLMMGGWMASLFFALVVSIFYHRFFPAIDMPAPPFAQVLISYSVMGFVISAAVAFFISLKS